MPSILLDANILYSTFLRNLLFVLAERDLLRVRWTAKIEQEWSWNWRRNNPQGAAYLNNLQNELRLQFPAALVTGYEALTAKTKLRDTNDQHVLAAAVHAEIPTILTYNTKDFPRRKLKHWNIRSIHPDFFLLEILQAVPKATVAALRTSELWEDTGGEEDFLLRLRKTGMPKFARRLGERLG